MLRPVLRIWRLIRTTLGKERGEGGIKVGPDEVIVSKEQYKYAQG